MILELQEVKEYLKIDYDDEDILLSDLITTAENYLYNATGKHFTSDNQLAKLYCRVLINDWFKDRGLTMTASKTLNASEKVRYTLKSIMLQLQYCEGDDNGSM